MRWALKTLRAYVKASFGYKHDLTSSSRHHQRQTRTQALSLQYHRPRLKDVEKGNARRILTSFHLDAPAGWRRNTDY
jgi:hypothetical protein